MSAAQAADVLDVTPRQVRNLIESGARDAQRFAPVWVIDSASVRRRAARPNLPGRPMAAAAAWSVLAAVQRLLDEDGAAALDLATGVVGDALDAQARVRLEAKLASHASPARWSSWLARRAHRRPMWVYPGAEQRLHDDERLHAGGAGAAHRLGLAVAKASPARYYLAVHDLPALITDYRLRDDTAGTLDLMVVPDQIGERYLQPGPVMDAVVYADLLESLDAREHHLAADAFERAVGTAGPDA